MNRSGKRKTLNNGINLKKNTATEPIPISSAKPYECKPERSGIQKYVPIPQVGVQNVFRKVKKSQRRIFVENIFLQK